jgi:rSAM/selenodomain-associated transferase 2
MTEISIIIPTLNEALNIVDCLKRLETFRGCCEIIVADGGSGDDTAALAVSHCDQVCMSEPGRARQMNAGAAGATGNYLFFLHADTTLSFNVLSLQEELQAQPDWGFAPVKLSGEDWRARIIEHFMVRRSTLTGVATGDQLIFVKRSLFEYLGGFADIPLMEDIEISKRLRRIQAPHILSKPVLTSSRRWESQGYLKTVAKMWSLRLAYFLGVTPRLLVQFYYGR